MKQKKTCFVISPIGEVGSEIRQNADDLLELIIKPALEIYGFEVTRGDHRSEPNQIDLDVIQSVQNADLCIVDVTGLNPNVMYELGRRDETLKDVIVLKTHEQVLPVDLGTRRCIEYDLDSRRGARDAVQQIRNFVEPMIERGFESGASTTSLSEIAAMLGRIERKLNQMTEGTPNRSKQTILTIDEQLPEGLTPFMTFKLALQKRDIHLAEIAMAHLEKEMDHLSFLDRIVEVAAAIGSRVAGEKLISCAQEFMDSDYSFHDKVDYVGYMTTYICRQDKEEVCLEMMEHIINELLLQSEGEDVEDISDLYNQRNRIYYGIFLSTEEEEWRLKALHDVMKAIEYEETEASYHYNHALIERKYNLPAALSAIERCMELGSSDDDHLSLAYRIYYAMDDPHADDIMERLQEAYPAVAEYVKANPKL